MSWDRFGEIVGQVWIGVKVGMMLAYRLAVLFFISSIAISLAKIEVQTQATAIYSKAYTALMYELYTVKP